MEKVIYVLKHDPQIDADAWASRLRKELATELQALGVLGLQVNAADSAVAPASAIRQTYSDPPVDGLVQVWLDTAIRKFREPVDQAVFAHAGPAAAYLVTESRPLPNRLHPPQPGQRTVGFSQIALLRRPQQLDYAAWLDIWHNSHTSVAVETQSNFEYVQNVVVRALTADAPPRDGIVEECFPAAAMTDPQVFFDAAGDEPKFQRNLALMMESVARFIDMPKIDVLATSQYRIF